jgi:hypothetical protein
MSEQELNEFQKAAADHGQKQGNLFTELWGFLRHNKKWWLLPILFFLLFFGMLIFLSGTGVAPFIYTLF